MKKIKAILMSAIICGLCCSCNSNITTAPDKTSETEETILSIPETTAETTAVTTTAKTETTTAITTTTTTATEKTYSTEPVNVPIDEFDSLEFNFTEDDIMLQNTISEIIDGAWEYVHLSVACGFDGDPDIECIEIDLGFGRAMEYYFLYDGTIEDIRTGMSRYYSQKVVEGFLSNYHKCELGEKTEIGYKPLNIDQYFTRLEIGGKIYSIDGGIGGAWISKEVESGKVISKTDNEIIYCYLSYGCDSDLYCIQDRLVYEDGWKYDSFYRFIPKEIISVEEYYPELIAQLSENTIETPIQSEYIDENGYLTEEFSKRVQLFIDSYVDRTASGAILTLQDFDLDNVPEIVYTAHDGGQQEKESKVYRAEDFHCYGSFDGFCRDGYTKFFNKYDGVIIHNFCEHSNQLRSDCYTHAIIEDDKLITTEIGSNDQEMQAGRLRDETKINDEFFEERGITNPKHVVNILENEEYSVTINEMADCPNKIENIAELYNSCKRIENTYKEICAASDSDFSIDFLCMDDYDGDGKPEAFFQYKKLGFINSNYEVIYLENGFDFTEYYPTYYAYGVRRIWNDVIVFIGMGNCEPCLVLTVRNGKPEEVKEISMQGMMFNYSEYEAGQFTLCQSAYDAPYHTWKPYFFYRDSNGSFKEYGAIYADIDEFTRVTGVDPYEVIKTHCADVVRYYEEDVIGDEIFPVKVESILYRSNGYYHINCGHSTEDILNENITIKCYGDGKYDVIYGDGGVYSTAILSRYCRLSREAFLRLREKALPLWNGEVVRISLYLRQIYKRSVTAFRR